MSVMIILWVRELVDVWSSFYSLIELRHRKRQRKITNASSQTSPGSTFPPTPPSTNIEGAVGAAEKIPSHTYAQSPPTKYPCCPLSVNASNANTRYSEHQLDDEDKQEESSLAQMESLSVNVLNVIASDSEHQPVDEGESNATEYQSQSQDDWCYLPPIENCGDFSSCSAAQIHFFESLENALPLTGKENTGSESPKILPANYVPPLRTHQET
jgi:hypothetical protein